MSKELNELTEQRYGLVHSGMNYYGYIDDVLVDVIKELETIKRPRLHNERSSDCMLTGGESLVDELNNMIEELEADDELNKIKDDVINFGSGFMLDGKHVPLQDIFKVCELVVDGKYTYCTEHNECWETDKDVIPKSCQQERTIQDELQVVADKIKAGHDFFESLVEEHDITNTHNFGNCINCTDCDKTKPLTMRQANNSIDDERLHHTEKFKSTRRPQSHYDLTMMGSENNEEHF